MSVGNGTPIGNNNSLSFDGVDDYTQLTNPMNFGLGSFSVSIDCYLNSFQGSDPEPYSYIVGTPVSNTNNDHGFKIHTSSSTYNGGFEAHINDAGTTNFNVLRFNNLTENNVQLNKWYHLTMVVDRTSNVFSFYVNGILVDFDNISSNFGDVDIGVPITVGAFSLNNTSLLNGKADNLQIWNKALVQSEIQSYISSPPTGNEAGLVGYWNFNEGSGSTVNDLSGNGNNGTINGAAWSTDAPAQYANNCTATDDVVVTVNPLPTIDLGADTTLICAGTSETLDAGTGFASYFWSDGSTAQTLSATTAGTYTVTGTDANGCIASDSMVIDVLTVDITQNDTTICEGDSLVLLANGSQTYPSGSNNSQLSGTLNSGLVGYWPFNGNANDESGNGNNGTVYGASLAQDRLGNNNSAYQFQVSSSGGWGSAQDRIVVSNPSIGNNNAFTMSSWVYLETKSGSFANRPHTIMGRWDGNGTSVFRHQINYDGTISTNLLDGSSSTTYSSVAINYNEWKHIVISYDGTTLKHFIDGQKVGEQVFNYQMNSSSTDLTFGQMLDLWKSYSFGN